MAKGSSSGRGSRDIPTWIGWEMVLLEECADDLGIAREQHYYDTLKPLYNYKRPGQTASEYRQTEAGKELNRLYRQKEEYKAAQKAYRQTEARREIERAACRAYKARKKAQSTSPF